MSVSAKRAERSGERMVVVGAREMGAKEKLPAEFRECLVLTVEESKGLEFNVSGPLRSRLLCAHSC